MAASSPLRLHIGTLTLQRVFVCWQHATSETFGIKNGVRQGRILSPFIISCINDCGIGCNVRGMFGLCRRYGFACTIHGLLIAMQSMLNML